MDPLPPHLEEHERPPLLVVPEVHINDHTSQSVYIYIHIVYCNLDS